MTTATRNTDIGRDIAVASLIRGWLRNRDEHEMLPEIEEVYGRMRRETNTDANGPYLDLTPVLGDLRGNIDDLKARYAA